MNEHKLTFTSPLALAAILPTLEEIVPWVEWWTRDSYWSNQVLGKTANGIRITIDPDEDPWLATAEFPESLPGAERERFLDRLRTEILGAICARSVTGAAQYQLTKPNEGELLLEWDHRPGADPDAFLEENADAFKKARRVRVRVREFDGDNVLVGLVAQLREHGVAVEIAAETPRAQDTLRALGWVK